MHEIPYAGHIDFFKRKTSLLQDIFQQKTNSLISLFKINECGTGKSTATGTHHSPNKYVFVKHRLQYAHFIWVLLD